MGRKSKINPERIDTIIASIERGEPNSVAAALAGISESTFYNWLDRGEADADTTGDIDPDDYLKRDLEAIARHRQIDITGCRTKADIAGRINAAPSPYVEFLERYKKATAQAESFVISQMVRTGQADWRFWMTFAERRWPTRWARRSRLDEIEDMGGIGSRPPEDAEAMLERADEIVVKMLGTGSDG